MKTTPVIPPVQEDAVKAKNEVIAAAYFAILSEVKQLIKLYPSEYLRTFIDVDYTTLEFSCKHGFYSPLIHLQLEENDGQMSISFARNYHFKNQIGNTLDSLLTRCVYKHTAEANTRINIEDSLNVNIYNTDDFRQAKSLLDRGFKNGSKQTIEQ